MLYEEDEALKLKQVLMTEAQNIAAKRYSMLRGGHLKWGFTRHEADQASAVEVLGDSVSLFLSVKAGKYLETFPVSSLRHRVTLKRNFDVFIAALNLWDMLNPFHIKGISKGTWQRVNEFLYKDVVNFPDIKQAKQYAHQDTGVDFQNKSALLFVDFYDSLFEFIDNYCKSKLASEFVRLIKRIYNDISCSRCLDSVSLHTKHHLNGVVQPSYAAWMLPFLKDFKKPKSSLKQQPDSDGLSFVRSM